MDSPAASLSNQPIASKSMSETVSSSIPIVADGTGKPQVLQVAVTLQIPMPPGGKPPPPPGTHRIEIKVIPSED
jgi:hypothetical protein